MYLSESCTAEATLLLRFHGSETIQELTESVEWRYVPTLFTSKGRLISGGSVERQFYPDVYISREFCLRSCEVLKKINYL